MPHTAWLRGAFFCTQQRNVKLNNCNYEIKYINL